MIGAQLALAALAPLAMLGSEMPRLPASVLATAACIYSFWRARREATRPVRQLLWPADDAPVLLDGEPLLQAALQWRGPLAFLHWRAAGGRRGHLSWWPDTLPAALRRELRLAAPPGAASRPGASMAP